MLIAKKKRFDFYRAVQNTQFHTAAMMEALTHGGELPENEAGAVLDYLRRVRDDLTWIESWLTRQPYT